MPVNHARERRGDRRPSVSLWKPHPAVRCTTRIPDPVAAKQLLTDVQAKSKRLTVVDIRHVRLDKLLPFGQGADI